MALDLCRQRGERIVDDDLNALTLLTWYLHLSNDWVLDMIYNKIEICQSLRDHRSRGFGNEKLRIFEHTRALGVILVRESRRERKRLLSSIIKHAFGKRSIHVSIQVTIIWSVRLPSHWLLSAAHPIPARHISDHPPTIHRLMVLAVPWVIHRQTWMWSARTTVKLAVLHVVAMPPTSRTWAVLNIRKKSSSLRTHHHRAVFRTKALFLVFDANYVILLALVPMPTKHTLMEANTRK